MEIEQETTRHPYQYKTIHNTYTDQDGFTLSDYLKQADECETLNELIAINKLFIASKYFFPLIYMEYGVEHFLELAHKLAKEDARKSYEEIYKDLK